MRWSGHEIDAAIYGHTTLVKRIAYGMIRRMPTSIDVDDLIQAGMVGLLNAATRFDPDEGTSFENFAASRIRGEMIDELRRGDWLPRLTRKAQRDIGAAVQVLQQREGRAPKGSEVAREMGLPLDSYRTLHAEAAGGHLVPLDDLDADEVLPANVSDEPLRLLTEQRFLAAFDSAMRDLPAPQRTVMSLYYAHDLNFAAIGEAMGFTESRACQVHAEAVQRLRRGLRDHGP